MSWRLRFRPEPFDPREAEIGDCWYWPSWSSDDNIRNHFLQFQASRQYLEQWADKRPPVVVKLPPGFGFSPDERYRGGPWGDNPAREGWTVSGRLDDNSLVVFPSINIIGTYHGWLQGGLLSDDVEGRRY